MDVHSQEQRSYNMSRIRAKDTGPEIMVRKWLWAKGYRYRLHKKDIPGKPDIILSKYNAVIFIHGCFWHRHGCKYTTTPATRKDFWTQKFKKNVERDKRNTVELEEMGWRVLILWECETKVWSDELERKIEKFIENIA